MHARFTGLIAAAHTPLAADGSLNPDVVERQAEYFLQSGVAGVFVAGTTGECHSLSLDERFQLGRRWVDVASGTGLKVILHVGHHSQPDAVELARQAGQIGADGIAAMAPGYFLPRSIDALLDFCAPIACAASGLPFYYYDIPGMTGVRFPTVEVLERGGTRIPNLCGVKFSNTDIRQLHACVDLDGGRFDVLYGCDEALLSSLVLGVRGAVGSTYNFAAPLYLRLLSAFDAGDLQEARRLQARSVRMVATIARYDFLPASKWLMSLLGVDCGPVRAPLSNLSESERRQLREDLLENGLLEPHAVSLAAPVV